MADHLRSAGGPGSHGCDIRLWLRRDRCRPMASWTHGRWHFLLRLSSRN